jgi:hypothetical protein
VSPSQISKVAKQSKWTKDEHEQKQKNQKKILNVLSLPHDLKQEHVYPQNLNESKNVQNIQDYQTNYFFGFKNVLKLYTLVHSRFCANLPSIQKHYYNIFWVSNYGTHEDNI